MFRCVRSRWAWVLIAGTDGSCLKPCVSCNDSRVSVIISQPHHTALLIASAFAAASLGTIDVRPDLRYPFELHSNTFSGNDCIQQGPDSNLSHWKIAFTQSKSPNKKSLLFLIILFYTKAVDKNTQRKHYAQFILHTQDISLEATQTLKAIQLRLTDGSSSWILLTLLVHKLLKTKDKFNEQLLFQVTHSHCVNYHSVQDLLAFSVGLLVINVSVTTAVSC